MTDHVPSPPPGMSDMYVGPTIDMTFIFIDQLMMLMMRMVEMPKMPSRGNSSRATCTRWRELYMLFASTRGVN